MTASVISGEKDSTVHSTPPIKNYSFYFQILAAIGLSAASLALIILQPVFLKPFLLLFCLGGIGVCFFKKTTVIEQPNDLDLSIEMEPDDPQLP